MNELKRLLLYAVIVIGVFTGCWKVEQVEIGTDSEDEGNGPDGFLDAASDTDADADTDADSDADSDADTDADIDTDADTDTDTGTGLGYWIDPIYGLYWQNPSSASAMNWFEAAGVEDIDGLCPPPFGGQSCNPGGATDYCGDGTWGGFDDWRLPDANELISSLRGCTDGTEAGSFGISICSMSPAGCVASHSCGSVKDCAPCDFDSGPGTAGCYRDPALSGTCSTFWSSSSYKQIPYQAFNVFFRAGSVSRVDKQQNNFVRCVRLGL